MSIKIFQAASPLLFFIIVQSYFHFTGKLSAAWMFEIMAVVGSLVFVFWKTKLKGRFLKRVFTALAVICIGMLYFQLQDLKFSSFLPTMLFFLVPQLYLISAFYLDFKSAPALDKSGARLAIGLTFLLSVGYYLQIRETLGILRMPVLIGIFSTSFLFMMACFRNLRVNKESFLLVLAGVFCYMFSEALLIYHSFVKPIHSGALIYSISSIAGLYLIVLGSIRRKLIHAVEPPA